MSDDPNEEVSRHLPDLASHFQVQQQLTELGDAHAALLKNPVELGCLIVSKQPKYVTLIRSRKVKFWHLAGPGVLPGQYLVTHICWKLFYYIPPDLNKFRALLDQIIRSKTLWRREIPGNRKNLPVLLHG